MDGFPTSGLPTSLPSYIFDNNDLRSLLTSVTKKSSSASTSDTTSSQTTPALSVMTSYVPSPVVPASYPTNSGYHDKDDKDSFFERLENGTKAAVGVAVTVGVIIIVALSVWYCCGCCGLRARRRKRREGLRAPDINSQRPVPLNTMNSSQAPPPAGDAPPQYEEAVPPRHQHIAGGARHIRQEEDDAVISDGKTPLSEIPFEDVVLDHSPSEGSSRSFSERHHGLGGDTRGHTNT
ncbi:hypothetical protein DL98DRAFT_584608 [Cadophora sp. DSE1049]|nr:hypothetical protein DL98DRAFT_584608 [Cadophora sp. DSE1049]